jgi:protein-S-isoprenylcysteine O-methyltransferase Ste14
MKSESDGRPDKRIKHTLSRWGIGKKLIAVSALYAIPAGMFTYLYPNLFIIPIPRRALKTAGDALLLIGILLLGWAAYTFTVGFNKGNLVTKGLFSLVRNPIYAVWMFFLIPGIALLCASWLLLLTPLVTYLGFTRFIQTEERDLTKRFGRRYLDYKARTHALWPGSTLARRRDQRRVK